MKKDVSIHFTGVSDNSLCKDEDLGTVVDESK